MHKFALYYPLMSPPAWWLKTAVLYWPKVARIRPRGFSPQENHVARVFAEELDFFVDVDPEDSLQTVEEWFRQAALDDFRREAQGIRDLLWELELSTDYLDRAFARLESEHTTPRQGLSTSRLEPTETEILRSLTTIRNNDYPRAFRGDLTRMDRRERFAWVYMCALATEVARRNHLAPATAYEDMFALGGNWAPAALAVAVREGHPSPVLPRDRGVDTVADALGLLSIEHVSPQDTDPKKLVKARRRYGQDFIAFRNEVELAAQELAEQLTDIRDQAVLEQYLRYEVAARFTGPAEQLGKALRGLGIQTTADTLTMKFEVPALLGVGGGILAHQPIIAGGSAVAAALVGIYGAARTRRQEVLQPSAATYLYHLKDDFPHSRSTVERAAQMASKISHRVRERYRKPGP
ncbi:DUF6236 family protein [Streptomyces sp. URMC 126]|uniref:DUF6236 family protein n=1 Tax=Streptomyces sp. URMC 126 TaxID=3423401 RepID=UPI003F1CA4D7